MLANQLHIKIEGLYESSGLKYFFVAKISTM